ncbi:MAG: FAD/NAD(P)-binding protein [Thermoplasmata archaeon]|nr:FAD/NAD(P)-binding protein [Thermoplasmata archaeon]
MASSPVAPVGSDATWAEPLAPVPYRVRRRSSETGDTATLVLEPVAGGAVPSFAPGQFNMLYAFGLGEVAVSISGDPTVRETLTHTVRCVGKISTALSKAPSGSVVGVRGPYGVGWPVAAAAKKDVVVLAGGLGLAPLRPVLYELLAHRERYGRVEVIYGARTPRDLLYYPEIQEWRQRTDWRFQVTVDAAGRDWYGDVGVGTTRLPDARFDPAETVAFVCGPEIMMRVSVRALQDRGVPDAAIYLSMERNMKCAVAFCGHCQLGPAFVCRDGPVLSFGALRPWLSVREI